MTDSFPAYTIDELPIELNDVAPIEEDDVGQVARIDTSADFKTAHNYWRGLQGEVSERAYRLTATCLQYNPANYTLWQHRRQCWAVVSTRPEVEWSLVRKVGGDNPKNYQIWHHLRCMVEQWEDEAMNSIVFINGVLKEDAKNYHAWSFRQWLAARMGSIWKRELDYTDKLIQDDVRNNSAWNHRWFVRQNFPSKDKEETEIAYAVRQGRLDPYNECPWRYGLAWIDKDPEKAPELDSTLHSIHENDCSDSANLCGTRVDVLELINTSQSLQKAIQLTDMLQEMDMIRVKYWVFRKDGLQKKLARLDTQQSE